MKFMSCKQCRFWLRDFSFPGDVGYCQARNAMTSASDVCEMFRRKSEEAVAVKVLHY
ncbi:MAG: hypothetical protein ABWW66_05335 [Archaeoglobaceae archaeon]